MEQEEIIVRLTETDGRSKRNEQRITGLEADNEILHKMATSIEIQAEQLKTMNDSLRTLNCDVQELKSKPAKRWEYVVEKVLYFIIAAVMGYFLAKAK
jgi:hypothetical protein